IPRGGGTLRDNLSHFCVATFASNDEVIVQIPGPGGIQIPLPIEVHNPAKPGGNMLSLVTSSLGTPDFDAFPASGGYILIVSADIPIAGAPAGGIELARYQS